VNEPMKSRVMVLMAPWSAEMPPPAGWTYDPEAKAVRKTLTEDEARNWITEPEPEPKPEPIDPELAATERGAIVALLRYQASRWPGCVYEVGQSEPIGRELAAIADAVEVGTGWDCCPICEEVTCDESCPLREHRQGMYF
jgi:hypothetical protein